MIIATLRLQSACLKLGPIAQLLSNGLGIVTGGIGGLFGGATDDSENEVDVGELGQLGINDEEVGCVIMSSSILSAAPTPL